MLSQLHFLSLSVSLSLFSYLMFIKQLFNFFFGRHDNFLVACHLLSPSFQQVSQILQSPFVLTLECKTVVETAPPGGNGHRQFIIHVLMETLTCAIHVLMPQSVLPQAHDPTKDTPIGSCHKMMLCMEVTCLSIYKPYFDNFS